MDNFCRERMERMESHLAHLTAWVQSTVIHTGSGTNRPGSAQSTSSLHSEPVSQKSSKYTPSLVVLLYFTHELAKNNLAIFFNEISLCFTSDYSIKGYIVNSFMRNVNF